MFVDKTDLASLKQFFTDNPSLASFINVYNSSLFVYTIRKCFENDGNGPFTQSALEFLFDKKQRPLNFYYLIDGDYPKRNLVHYAARYNSVRMLELIRHGLREEIEGKERKNQHENDLTCEQQSQTKEEIKKLEDILLQVILHILH